MGQAAFYSCDSETPDNQKHMVVPTWQLKSFTWEMAVWGNIESFLVVWGSRQANKKAMDLE